ncbi:hypothetical protein ACOMHN_039781 [Nucella lapillus]
MFPALPVFQRPPPHRCSLSRPHLLLLHYNNHSNRRIHEQELSCVLLTNFIERRPPWILPQCQQQKQGMNHQMLVFSYAQSQPQKG